MGDLTPILVPIAAITFLFGGPVAAFIVWRVFAHQERMEMIRRGVMPPMSDNFSYRDARRGNWPGAPGGMGVPPPGAVPPPFYATDPTFYAQNRLRKGITVSMVGLALLIGMSLFSPGRLGPPSVIGFVVLFVGIAQIINALMCGAQFPFTGASHSQPDNSANYGNSANFGPPPNSPMPPTPPGGAYGWRPDGTPEIQKPVSPPDQR